MENRNGLVADVDVLPAHHGTAEREAAMVTNLPGHQPVTATRTMTPRTS